MLFEDNRARPNVGPVVPGLFGSDAVKFNPQVYDVVDGKPRRKSIDEARRLLAEAGYPDGRERGTGKPLVINYDTQGVGPGYKARNDWTNKQFAKSETEPGGMFEAFERVFAGRDEEYMERLGGSVESTGVLMQAAFEAAKAKNSQDSSSSSKGTAQKS